MKKKKKNKRSYFRKVGNRKDIIRRNTLLKYIPKQPKLIKFLLDNEADEKFIIALQNASSYTRKQALIREDKYDAICSSFTWRETKEGHSYWDVLSNNYNNKWCRDNL